MCANCVAQGAVYVGGALAGLQVMAARARRRAGTGSAEPAPSRPDAAGDGAAPPRSGPAGTRC